jgi:hypothetical protein
VNGDDHFSSKLGVGGLLNTDKVNLARSPLPSIYIDHIHIITSKKVCLIMDNLEAYHRHHRQLGRYVPSLAAEWASSSGVQPANDGSPGAEAANNSLHNVATALLGGGGCGGQHAGANSSSGQPQQVNTSANRHSFHGAVDPCSMYTKHL